jgi:hypothetical protein
MRQRSNYLSFIHSFASCVQWPSEVENWPEDDEIDPYVTPTPYADNIVAHHVRMGAGAGMGQKPSDFWAVPLTSDEHHDLHSNGEAGFWAKHDKDPRIIICRLITLWLGEDVAFPIVANTIGQALDGTDLEVDTEQKLKRVFDALMAKANDTLEGKE